MTRTEIVTAARALIGVPWRHQGRTLRGLDCIGLLVEVAKTLGVHYVDRTDYSRDPTHHALLDHLRQFTTFCLPSAEKTGLIGVFRQSSLPCHVGIFATDATGATTLIHTLAPVRKVIEQHFVAEQAKLIELRAFPGMVT